MGSAKLAEWVQEPMLGTPSKQLPPAPTSALHAAHPFPPHPLAFVHFWP